jgi:membrane-associated phospholipid phosphatase
LRLSFTNSVVNIMKFFKKILSENSYFFLSIGFCLFVGFLIVFNVRKGNDVVWLNQFHQPFADFFFQYITHLGDGLFCIFLSLIFLLFRKYKNALLIFFTFALSGLLAQFFKKIIFPDMLRPIAYLGEQAKLQLVEGVEVYTNNSFPSGHTANAFATFLMLTLIIKKNNWGFFLFFLALLVAISRVYLVQHFFVDVYAGAWLGTMSTVFVYYWVEQWEKRKKT